MAGASCSNPRTLSMSMPRRASFRDNAMSSIVAYSMKGCSSLERLRFAVLLGVGKSQAKEGGLCLIDIKEAVQAAAPRHPAATMSRHDATRVVEGARHRLHARATSRRPQTRGRQNRSRGGHESSAIFGNGSRCWLTSVTGTARMSRPRAATCLPTASELRLIYRPHKKTGGETDGQANSNL